MSVYTDLTARFTYGLSTVFGDFSKLANNDKFLKDNGWQDGTVGVFFQAAAPAGWTRFTAYDAKALRITAGSGGGFGGTNDPATTIAVAHTHTISTDGTHSHVIAAHSVFLSSTGPERASGAHTAVVDNSGDLAVIVAGANNPMAKKNSLSMSGGSYSTDSNGSHNHGGVTDSQLSDVTLAYFNVVLATKDTSSGYTDLSLTFVHNSRHVADYMQSLAQNDAFNYARRTPAGTVTLFGTSTAPTGWTKATSQNGKLCRVVGTADGGGTGGSADCADAIASAHTHSVTSGGGHTHASPAHTHTIDDDVAVGPSSISTATFVTSSSGQLRERSSGGIEVLKLSTTTGLDGSGTTTSNGAHTHTVGSGLSSITLAYFNVIQASKDSAGAPQSYTDLTALFATYFSDQFLLAYQEMQLLAYNDAYLYYHTMPTGAVAFFCQASAPLTWTKLTAQDDKLMRIVSDATGGTAGGNTPLSSATLAHTHTLSTADHTHTFDHTHTLALSANQAFMGTFPGTRIFGDAPAQMYKAAIGGAGSLALATSTDVATLTMDTQSHAHGGATGRESGTSDLLIAYANVIMCSKN